MNNSTKVEVPWTYAGMDYIVTVRVTPQKQGEEPAELEVEKIIADRPSKVQINSEFYDIAQRSYSLYEAALQILSD